MKFFNLRSPCGSCPFKKEPYFHLHPDRRQSIADGLKGDETFTCHGTIDYDECDDTEDFQVDVDANRHCAGALIVMAKEGTLFSNRMPRIAAHLGWFDPDKLDMSAPVYDSLEEFARDRGENS